MTSAQLLDFKEIIKSNCTPNRKKTDRHTRSLLLYLFTSTRGGLTRLRIIMMLMDGPYNTHQLSVRLGLDYKAVQHHMKVLEKNNLVSRSGKRYGAVFCLSLFLEENICTLDEAIDRLDKKLNRKKVYL